ncbi:cysteine desulfurase [bacterium]|nr:cysteine desulfurase [bacterium]
MKPIYLDYAATTPVDPAVKEAMMPYFDLIYGNPSSGHQPGQDALDAVERARAQVAGLIGAAPEEIVFTGSGTESDNTAIKSACLTQNKKGNHIITTAFEHKAVLASCHFMETQGVDVTYIRTGRDGVADPDDIRKAITDKTVLVSIMHANNEIGTLQPLREIGMLTRERGVLFHTDAVQTTGHIPLDVRALNLDFLSLSAHKLYGPKGVGVLYIRNDVPFEPLLHGGGHEKGRRSSTHNVPGIVGLGKAAEIAGSELAHESNRIRTMRDDLWDRLNASIPGIHLNGSPDRRLPNNLNVSIEHTEGEALLINLDMEGIAVSSGSACSSDSGSISHVLEAIGVNAELARGSLRITLGRYTTPEEIDRISGTLPKIVSHLRSIAAF